jgi:light-regulated signal transduction histidine kinase (bacteriophytochrome)
MPLNNQDLNECDKEPIHIPSAIQPHGFFLAVDINTMTIVAASSNIDLFFTFSSQQILSQSLYTFFPFLHQWLQEEQNAAKPLPKIFTVESSLYIFSMHRNNTSLILEAELALNADLFPDTLAQSLVNETISLTNASSIDEICLLGAQALQRLSGFGRVMSYRFDKDFNGWVNAEAKIPPMESYLNHHFPAGDIPAQARELYRTNLIRYIPNATYVPVPLQSIVNEPIDMSQSTLRSVSPIHLEYLRNMDVESSMSLSIIVDGKLWGLFACHHPSPLPLAYTIRHYCEMFIGLFNALIQERLSNESSQLFFALKNRYSVLKEAFQTLTAKSDLHTAFTALGSSWLEAMESDGVCLLQKNECSVFGAVPPNAYIREFSSLIDPFHENDLFVSIFLGDILLTDSISGVLSLIITHNPRTEIIWFRREWVQTITWAGNPDKAVLFDHSQRISPRKSFEAFTIEQRGKSIPWSSAHLLAVQLYKELGSVVELDNVNRTLKRQNQLLIQQGKMAMMGEMIGAISHQWMQPLNALSLLISNLSMTFDKNINDSKTVTDIKQKSMDKIEFMADSIHSFRNFFKPDRTKIFFPVMQMIHEVNDQLLPQLKVNNVELNIDENEIQIYGSPNEFKQIILNLLVNAHDALIEKKIQNPIIRCSIERGEAATILQICDNAGGILPEHLEAIFTPYFSTKMSETGRGLGLYLSKLIMEEQFGGTISVVNTDEGACFRLSFLTLS